MTDEQDVPWPFVDPPETGVITTQPVLDGHPVQVVSHDEDGDWQLLCGTTLDTGDARIVHLGHLVGAHPSLGQLADLPRGWRATLEDDGTWERTPKTLRARLRRRLGRGS